MKPPAETLAYKEASIEIGAGPDAVYGLVSDLPRMGEWSPEATGGRWMDDGTGRVGDWFEGHNKAGEREWTRESEVVVAEPGREFVFVVGGVEANRTWWCYEMSPTATGTLLTEKWWIVNKAPALLAATEEQFQGRVDVTQRSIEHTLAAIKATAEASAPGS